MNEAESTILPRGALPISAHRVNFSMRIRPQMRQELEDRANRNGRSYTQEAETMLERQLQLDRVFGDKVAPAFDLAIAFALHGARGAIEHLLNTKTASLMELQQYILSVEGGSGKPA